MTNEELNIWERSKGVIEVLTCKEFGAWLHRRDMNIQEQSIKSNEVKPELEPCEDCVSREAALEAVEEQKKGFYGVERYAIDECYSAIMKLPSVKPQRPKGKWINNTYNHHCSECGYGLTNETYMFYGLNRENDERHDCYCGWEDNLMNYCPCCGAEMEDSND